MRLISELEKRIEDQSLIIQLLRSGNRSYAGSLKSDVARSSEKEQSKSDGGRGNVPKPIETSVTSLGGCNSVQYVVGGSDATGSTGLQAAQRRAWVHIGRLAIETTAEQIQEHLVKKFPRYKKGDFVIEALPRRSDAKSISFKVGADITLLEGLSESENWPVNVTVRRFNFFRDRRTAQMGSASET